MDRSGGDGPTSQQYIGFCTIVSRPQRMCRRLLMLISVRSKWECNSSVWNNRSTWSDSSCCFHHLHLFFPYSCLILLLHQPFPPRPPHLGVSHFPLLSCQLPWRQCCHGDRAAGQISWCLVLLRRVHKSFSCICSCFTFQTFFFGALVPQTGLQVQLGACEQTRLFLKNQMVLKVAFFTGTTLASFLPLHDCRGTCHVFIRLVIHCCHEKTHRGHYSNMSWQPHHIRAFGTNVAHLQVMTLIN